MMARLLIEHAFFGILLLMAMEVGTRITVG